MTISCSTCGGPNPSDFRQCEGCREKGRIRSQRYGRSSHGRARRREYERSVAKAKVRKRYLASEKGQAMLRRQSVSEPRRKSRARYMRTKKGAATRLRRYHSEKARHPEKIRARQALMSAIRRGRIQRQPCRICGARAEGHHRDYSRPLDVDWLCKAHHQAEHERKAS